MWCFCGKVAKFGQKCERHINKEPKEKRQTIGRYRGLSNWGKENGLFVKVK